MNRVTHLTLASLVLLSASMSACKSVGRSNSEAKALEAIPGPYVSRNFWADGIEQVMAPAKVADLPPLAHNLSGLWYMKSPIAREGRVGLASGVALFSLAGGMLDKNNKLWVAWGLPYNFAFDSPRGDMAAPEWGGARFIIEFHDDKNADMLRGGTDGGVDNKYAFFALHMLEDGKWTRQSASGGEWVGEYTMLRIVDENGRRIPSAYKEYLDDCGKEKKFAVVIPRDSRYGHGSIIPGPGGRLVNEGESADEATSASRDGADDADRRPAEASGDNPGKAKDTPGKR